MTNKRIFALATGLAVALSASVAPAGAQVNAREPDPAAWLRQVYGYYHRMENADTASDQLGTKLVAARASKSFGAALKKDEDCSAKEEGVCALDWDFIIDGQEWRLSKVKVAPAVVAGDKATVAVSFTNMRKACRNIYYFVREDGEWKLDDVDTKSGVEAPLRISKLFKDYDYGK